jgi:hypothetical protein
LHFAPFFIFLLSFYFLLPFVHLFLHCFFAARVVLIAAPDTEVVLQ